MTTVYTAKPYVAGTPQAEVSGAAMIAFMQNLRAEHVRPILEELELTDIDENSWYPHQTWFDILKELENRLGSMVGEIFVAFGKQVVETAVMPPAIKTIPDALNALHAIHHANLRNIPEDEGYFIEKLADNKYVVYQNTPNPNDAIYGFLWGLAQRFKGPDEKFVVRKLARSEHSAYPGTPFEVRWWKPA